MGNYGRELPYFNNLVWATFTTHVLMPRDLKYVMTMLLSLMEYTLWEGVWKRLLNQFLQDYTNDLARTLKHVLYGFIHPQQVNTLE